MRCDREGDAIFVRGQHVAVVKIKYRKKFIPRYANFVYYNYDLLRESVKLYLYQIAISKTSMIYQKIGRPSEGQYGL